MKIKLIDALKSVKSTTVKVKASAFIEFISNSKCFDMITSESRNETLDFMIKNNTVPEYFDFDYSQRDDPTGLYSDDLIDDENSDQSCFDFWYIELNITNDAICEIKRDEIIVTKL